jgi:DNA repair exonuclease SbcCD ATPase subunit
MPEEKDVLAEFKTEDGGYDVDKVIEFAKQKANETDSLYKESKKRAERLKSTKTEMEQKEQALAEREKQIKAAEEEKLKEQEKYKELLEAKEAELAKYSTLGEELKGLKEYKQRVIDQQTAKLESKVSMLSEKDRELYETAAAGMVEDAYDQKLAFIEKLTKKTDSPKNEQIPAGGRDVNQKDYSEPSKLYELKSTNPELYKTIIREKMEPTK